VSRITVIVPSGTPEPVPAAEPSTKPRTTKKENSDG
jgi:hypothetical protein